MSDPLHDSPETPLQIAWRGARENLVPGLILQAFALGLAIAYYQNPGVHGIVDHYAALRGQMGVWLPMLSTAFFGGVIPFIYLRAFGAADQKPSFGQGLAILLFWFYKGWEVDLLYRVLAHVFGTGTSPGTIIAKVITDQFLYNVLLAAPATWAMYAWSSVNFSFRRLRTEAFAPGWYGRGILPMLISTWGVWIPAVAIIYTLPTALQLPMQNLVLCFFTLLVETLARRKHHHPQITAAAPALPLNEELL